MFVCVCVPCGTSQTDDSAAMAEVLTHADRA